MGLCFAKKGISLKEIAFSKSRYKNMLYFNLVHAQNPKFGLFVYFFAITRSDLFFSCLFLSLSSALLLSLTFALHILPGCRTKLDVNYGQG